MSAPAQRLEDMHSDYAHLWGEKCAYLYSKDTVLSAIQDFAAAQKEQTS